MDARPLYGSRLLWGGIAVATVAIATAASTNELFHDILILTLFWGAMATAWNLAGGFAGQISIGHSAFFGIGAYTSTLLLMRTGLSPWAGMVFGGMLSGVLAAFLSVICFRLRGPFFILATLAFSEVMRIVALNWRSVTEGSFGLQIPFRAGFGRLMFSGKEPYAYLALALAVGVITLSWWINRSRLGFHLKATREDEEAAEAIGVDTQRVKLLSFTLSAILTSFGGSFFAQYFLYIEPNQVFSFELSIQLPLMTVIGGIGTVFGPALGALVIIPLSELLRGLLGGGATGLYLIIYGIILILVVMFMPEGIVGRVGRGGRRT